MSKILRHWRILVAEDDRFLSQAYGTKLNASGFDVKIVADGEEALKEYSSFAPDIVILDLKLPKVDGFAFLETLLKNSQVKRVPIIVASNSGDKGDIERAIALGATDYVVKSNLSMKGLLEKINLLLRNTPPA